MSKINARFRTKALLALAIGVPSLARPAFAVLTTDSTSIGKHTSYGTSYSAFWRAGKDYSLLTDGTDTFLNSPSAAGYLRFRAANHGTAGLLDLMTLSPAGTLEINSTGTYAIEATAQQGNGIGVLAEGPYVGVQGTHSGAVAVGYGVFGSSPSTQGIGVWGYNVSGGGSGVKGTAAGAAVAVYGDNTNASGWAGYFNGKVFASGGYTSSDARLKKDVQEAPYGSEQLQKLRPVVFRWKQGDDRVQLGFIAQDVEKIVPEVVQADGQTGMLSMNYPALVPVLVKGFQQQQKLIEEQAARIASLERGRGLNLASWFTQGQLGMGLGLGLLPLGLAFTMQRRRALRANGK